MSSPAVQPLLALLACPVGGIATQYVLEQTFAHHELDWRYLTFEVGPEDLADAMRGLRALGFRGAHCAAPHKQAVIPLLDRTTETAAAIGAVNLVFREENSLVGENTEGRGVVQAIRAALDPAGKQVVLLGAGQLARAMAVELAAAGAAGLVIVNRTEARAEELAALLAGKFSLPRLGRRLAGRLRRAAGSRDPDPRHKPWPRDDDARLPLVVESLRPELLVVDATAVAPERGCSARPAARGCKTIDGLSMFIEQLAIGVELWTAIDPDRQIIARSGGRVFRL